MDVKNYLAVFNERYSEIPGYEKFMEKIQRTEAQFE